jgi:anti-sigma-K factor RskA
MSKLTCAEVEAVLPALVLGALDDDERADVMAHVDLCPGCRQKLAEYQALSRGLLEAVPQRTPPAAIKQTLMARVQPKAQPWPRRVANWLRGRQTMPRWALTATYALVVIVVALSGYEMTRLANQQASLATQLAEQKSAIALLTRETSAINMTGTQVASGASAVMRFSPQDTMAVVQTIALPPLSAGKAYQLWLIDSEGKHDSGAVFTIPPGSEGSVTLIIAAPRPMKDYVGCGVSIEPQGGSPSPTGPAALTGKLWS